MKLFPYIKEELSKFLEGDDYINLMIRKFEVPEYEQWKNLVNGFIIDGGELVSESTGQNVCYTAFKSSSRDIGDVKIIDFFYVHKSIIGDFYTIYIKSKLLVNYPDGKIRYPHTLIVSPESIYATFFQEARNLIMDNFPNAQMVPFSILSKEVEFNIPKFINEKINYYRALFGYEGNILNLQLTGDTWFRY